MKKKNTAAILFLSLCIATMGSIHNGNFKDETEIITEYRNKAETIAGNISDSFIYELKQLLAVFGYKDKQEKKKITSFEMVALVRVVDGDTIVVETEQGEEIKVRLTGVDTPESVHADIEKNTLYGEIASKMTSTLLQEGQILYLEYDEEREDVYGRTLAYVWDSEPSEITYSTIKKHMLNGVLIYSGYAINKDYPPNVKYADEFKKMAAEACEDKSGFWDEEEVVRIWVSDEESED